MSSNNSINDTYKVYKGSQSQEWSRINYYWPVGTWLTVSASLKLKQPKSKLSVWLIQLMGAVAIVLLTSHKKKELQEKTWIKRHKNQKYQEQNQIYVNLRLKTHVKYWLQEDTNNKNWKVKEDGV